MFTNIIKQALDNYEKIFLNHITLPNIKIRDINQSIPDNYDLIVINPSRNFINSILPFDYIIEVNDNFELISDKLLLNKSFNTIEKISSPRDYIFKFTNRFNERNVFKAFNEFNNGKVILIDNKPITVFEFNESYNEFRIESDNKVLKIENIKKVEIKDEYRKDYELITLFKNNMDTHSFVLVSSNHNGVFDLLRIKDYNDGTGEHEITLFNKITLEILTIPSRKLHSFDLIEMELK